MVLRWAMAAALLAVAMGCGFPGAPAHSTVTFSSDSIGPGTVATYSCDRGFELLGPARKECQGNSTWTPAGIPFCVINVAAGKAPMQSSTAQGGIPQKAVDGSTSGFFNPKTCTLTEQETSPLWYVNLLEPYMVQLVRLDFGRSCCENNVPATVVVRVGNNRPDLKINPICNRFTGFLEEGRPLFLPCNPPMPGAFISVHLEGPPGQMLSICEAFVYTDQALPIERCPQFRDQPPGSTATYNGKCYTFYNQQPQRFSEAQEFCQSRGGTLIDETNPALQGFLSWELWRRHREDPNGQYWMGAVRDPQNPANWKWITGQDLGVSFWSLPGGQENCARFDGTKDWLWSDTNCDMRLNFICQHQPLTCGKPEQPPNSTLIAPDFNVGSTISYRCEDGHLLSGPEERQCLETGFYSAYPPTCKNLQCGMPAEIRHGRYSLVNGTRGYLSMVVYECDQDFVMVGRNELICDVDERWSGPPPRCEPVFCKEPPAILNGGFRVSTNSTIVGTLVEYYCLDDRFTLTGPSTLRCMRDGTYNQEPPVCRETVLPTTDSARTVATATPTSGLLPTEPGLPSPTSGLLPTEPGLSSPTSDLSFPTETGQASDLSFHTVPDLSTPTDPSLTLDDLYVEDPLALAASNTANEYVRPSAPGRRRLSRPGLRPLPGLRRPRPTSPADYRNPFYDDTTYADTTYADTTYADATYETDGPTALTEVPTTLPPYTVLPGDRVVVKDVNGEKRRKVFIFRQRSTTPAEEEGGEPTTYRPIVWPTEEVTADESSERRTKSSVQSETNRAIVRVRERTTERPIFTTTRTPTEQLTEQPKKATTEEFTSTTEEESNQDESAPSRRLSLIRNRLRGGLRRRTDSVFRPDRRPDSPLRPGRPSRLRPQLPAAEPDITTPPAEPEVSETPATPASSSPARPSLAFSLGQTRRRRPRPRPSGSTFTFPRRPAPELSRPAVVNGADSETVTFVETTAEDTRSVTPAEPTAGSTEEQTAAPTQTTEGSTTRRVTVSLSPDGGPTVTFESKYVTTPMPAAEADESDVPELGDRRTSGRRPFGDTLRRRKYRPTLPVRRISSSSQPKLVVVLKPRPDQSESVSADTVPPSTAGTEEITTSSQEVPTERILHTKTTPDEPLTATTPFHSTTEIHTSTTEIPTSTTPPPALSGAPSAGATSPRAPVPSATLRPPQRPVVVFSPTESPSQAEPASPAAGDTVAVAAAPGVISFGRPEENEIPDTVNIQQNAPGVSEPDNTLGERSTGPKLHMGGIIALSVFGGFVFLAAVVTTIVILIRRSREL
ncbi:uncharacterized protein LOC122379064 isoform X2 [Amphibalanus amphitrite]|uniref:uncharacterized protein LOC122379064 isoform X2 n=1 Tax=Amphibalanus amphitrite TaxID=1232801 RepID=UPI001C91CEA3|nr:uncharacterized protein LOC122379064 isoform X2 [Amphibalanus amphitrite]